MAIEPAESHVENVSLSETPAIAAHVCTKIKFWHLRPDGALLLLLRIHLKFGFLRSNNLFTAHLGSHKTCDRAEVPTGADHQIRPNVCVHDPALAIALQALERHTFNHTRSRAPQ